MNRLKRLRKRKLINYYEPDEPSFDEYIYCEYCYDFVYEYCSIHGPLLIIPDTKVTSMNGIPPWVPRAALTTPRQFVHIAPSIIPAAGLGVFSSLTLPLGVRFGPYRGKLTDEVTSLYCWQIQMKTKVVVVDGLDGETSNWMRYVNCARNWREQNLVAFQFKGQIYYRTVKIIPKFTELLVFYGSEFAHTLGIDLKNYNKPEVLQIGKYIVEDVSSNQTETNNEDIYKTETLAICEATPQRNEENKGNVETLEENNDNIEMYEGNKENVETYEEIIEQSTYANALQTEFSIDTPQSNDFSNILATHDNNHDISIKKERVECDICYKTYKNTDSLRRHKYMHTEPNEARYSCAQCTYKTNLRYHFNVHMDRHRKDKIFKCELCSYVGHVRKDLRQHWRRAHRGSELAHTLGIDLKNYNKSEVLQIGKNIVEDVSPNQTETNNEDSIYKTETGEATSQRNEENKGNVETLEENNDNFEMYTGNKENVETYKEIIEQATYANTLQIEFSSDKPQSKLNNVSNIIATHDNNHDISINKERVECDICYKTYKNINSLRKHKYKHIEPNEARYSCTQCTYKTNKTHHFNEHMHRHRKDKIFKCELCSYVGHVSRDLRRHWRRTHKGKKETLLTYDGDK